MNHIVIVGNGIAGITTARHLRKKGKDKITVISNETDHFISRTALMYVYMGHMRYKDIKPYEDGFWKKNRIDLIRDQATSIDTNNKTIILEQHGTINYDQLVLATGSSPKKFGWPGEDLKGVRGMYHWQDVEAMEEYSTDLERAVIVGGGLIGIEMAEMFLSRKIPVTMLVKDEVFWGSVLPKEEGAMISKHIREHHIDLRTNTTLDRILGDNQGRVKAVITTDGEEIPCQFAGVTIGVTPNIKLAQDSPVKTDRGILVDEYLQTNIPDIYAIGDCAQHKSPPPKRKNVEQVWYTARMMGETLAETLVGKKTAYQPGIWFNSAKFLDIEYQNYGWVFPEPAENETSIYWEDESGKMALRLVYDINDQALKGINAFGVRLSHDICENWIKNSTPVTEVIQDLEHANFDPEYYPAYEKKARPILLNQIKITA